LAPGHADLKLEFFTDGGAHRSFLKATS
jgi:hypothetical protein